MQDKAPFLLAVMGATATGKTEVAEALAERYSAVLINADAFQIYRGLDIGTAKPAAPERYHLIDIKNPDEAFGVGEWTSLATPLLADIYQRGRNAIVVGGTGLYVRALFEGYTDMAPAPDPAFRASIDARERLEGLESLALELSALAPIIAEKTDLKNPARVKRALEKLHSPQPPLTLDLPPYRRHKFALHLPKEDLDKRIGTRVLQMVHNGWVRELEKLRSEGFLPLHPAFRALGYREMWRVMEGEVDVKEATATTIAETCRYAKRQKTWLRSEPGLDVISLDSGSDVVVESLRVVQKQFEREV